MLDGVTITDLPEGAHTIQNLYHDSNRIQYSNRQSDCDENKPSYILQLCYNPITMQFIIRMYAILWIGEGL
jgi:hypothetical protein